MYIGEQGDLNLFRRGCTLNYNVHVILNHVKVQVLLWP